MSEQNLSAGESDRRALALRLMGMATQFWVPQALYVAVTLGIAERLAAGPRSSEDLAREVAAHPDRLRRLLRALSSVGVFAEDPDHRFRQTPLSAGSRARRRISVTESRTTRAGQTRFTSSAIAFVTSPSSTSPECRIV